MKKLITFVFLLLCFSFLEAEAKKFRLFNRWSANDERAYQHVVKEGKAQCNEWKKIQEEYREENLNMKFINAYDPKVRAAIEKCVPGALEVARQVGEHIRNTARFNTYIYPNSIENIIRDEVRRYHSLWHDDHH